MELADSSIFTCRREITLSILIILGKKKVIRHTQKKTKGYIGSISPEFSLYTDDTFRKNSQNFKNTEYNASYNIYPSSTILKMAIHTNLKFK